MIRFSLKLLLATVLIARSVTVPTTASPFEADTRAVVPLYSKDDYGPFRLYVQKASDPYGAQMVVKLIAQPKLTATGVVHNLSVCTESTAACGETPSYWELKNQVLYAVFLNAPVGSVTVNLPVKPNSVVQFVKVDNPSVKKQLAPEWCATRNPVSRNGLPGLLSVLRSADDFAMCKQLLVPTTSSRTDVYYKVSPYGIGDLSCVGIKLVMQSTGTKPEPIPE